MRELRGTDLRRLRESGYRLLLTRIPSYGYGLAAIRLARMEKAV